MPSKPCLHISEQHACSIKEDEIQYTHYVRDVECGVITPLVLTNAEDVGCEGAVFCRCLAGVTMNTGN